MKQIFGVVFLLVGAILVFGAALVWFVPALSTPAPPQTAVSGPDLEELPPALNPVAPPEEPEEAIVYSLPEAISKALLGLAGKPKSGALLPESPLVEEKTAVGEETALIGDETDPAQPLRIIIPALGIDAPVVPVSLKAHYDGRREYSQWSVPDAYAAGWHNTSAVLGEPGNLVLNGHNNIHGALFGDLASLPVGEQIVLLSKEHAQVYRVTQSKLLPEQGQTLRERLQNARWIEPTKDERLTLVSCWPKTTNSHRVIVVAMPLADEG